ncbi:transporter substrate-binding domain-containing protein, partial [Staphylococcus epidermidis]|uniref:transporter substrate-binding domain-containing protein n=1 Tax=Staphylococcus epidermidis TaxID=1282 RepID=UPI000F884E0A
MKRLLLCIVALVFVLAACGNNSSNNKDNQSSSKDKDTLRVGTEGTYAPFTYHNKNDQLTGYDIDVIKAVAKEENLKLKFNETSWDSMFAGLDAGRFDVIANQVGVNKDREKKYKFSEPYTYSSAVLVSILYTSTSPRDRQKSRTLSSLCKKLKQYIIHITEPTRLLTITQSDS